MLVEEVELLYFVGVVVYVVVGVDVVVVGYHVEVFGCVHGCGDWVDVLVGCLFVVLAGDRLDGDLWLCLVVIDEVVVEVHPVHFAFYCDLYLVDDWDVVLGLVGDDACAAVCVGGQVHCYCSFVVGWCVFTWW